MFVLHIVIHIFLNTFILLIMKEQQRQTYNFEGLYKNFSIKLESNQASETFIIKVENTLTKKKYIQSVNNQFISQRPDLDCYFDASSLFDYLIDNFKKIIVEEGSIHFFYSWGKVTKKERTIKINLIQQNNSETNIEQMNKILVQKDARIKELQQKMQYQMEIMQKMIDSKDQIILQLLLKIERIQYERKLIQLSIEKQSKDKYFQTLLSKYLKIPQQYSKNEYKNWVVRIIGHHPENPHQEYYQLSNIESNHTKVLRVGPQDIGFNFVNRTEIPPQHKAKYLIKVNKTINGYLGVGFCVKEGIGQIDFYNNPQSAYYAYQGGFWKGGQYQINNEKSGVEDVIQCQADLISDILRWRKNGIILSEFRTPQKMKGKTIYFSLVMVDTGDEVELFA